MKTLKKNSGFTLLEVLVTMIISGVLVATVMLSFISSKQSSVKNRNRIIALEHATSAVEFLKNYVTADSLGTKYQKPLAWGDGTNYALQGNKTAPVTHAMPLKFDSLGLATGVKGFSHLEKKVTPWTRKYAVKDITVIKNPVNPTQTYTLPDSAPIKQVTITVSPQ